MINSRFTLAVVLAFLLCPHYASAQHKSSQTANPALREKAVNLLASVAGQLGNLQSAENRARLGANIADSLWDHDEKRARAVIALVEDDIKAGLANRDLKDPKDSHTVKVFLKLRLETVERIAKYDAERALSFLKSTEFISEKPLRSDYTEIENDFEIRLARQTANNNPVIAVKLARQSLDQGFSADLMPLLRELSRKDKEQTLILYKAIVNKLRDADLPGDWKARQFAENLAQSFRPPTQDNSAFRELVGVFITRALDEGCANKVSVEDSEATFCYWAASVLPRLERIDPRAAQLKRWVREEIDINVPPEAIQEWFDAHEEGNVERMLAFAAKYPPFAQDAYWEVVRKVTTAGDLEQARKILKQHVADSERKQEVLSALERRMKSTAIEGKRLAAMEATLDQIPLPIDRVRFLLTNAEYYGGFDRNAASALLKRASDTIETMKPGREQIEAQIALATTYCLEKDDRGFAIMESLLPKLNELVDAAFKLDGYETGYVRDGEWNMSANGSVGAILTKLSTDAGHFAWSDFDRAVSLSAQFERTEIRLMAQVKLAQAILAGPQQRALMELDFLH